MARKCCRQCGGPDATSQLGQGLSEGDEESRLLVLLAFLPRLAFFFSFLFLKKIRFFYVLTLSFGFQDLLHFPRKVQY